MRELVKEDSHNHMMIISKVQASMFGLGQEWIILAISHKSKWERSRTGGRNLITTQTTNK